MLESTFMATHSSFFAIIGVIDQFAEPRDAFGGVLGLFGAIRWLKAALTGRPSGTGSFNHHEFQEFISGKPVQRPTQKTSKKPLILFLLVVVGIPYAVTKLMKVLQERAVANGGASFRDSCHRSILRLLHS